MALVETVDLTPLTGIFSNPEHFPSCARCIFGAATKGILQGQGTAGSKTFWTNFAQDLDFWRSLVRFLFAIRTEEETREILSRLNRCSCKMRDRRVLEYHRFGRVSEGRISTRTCVDGQTSAALLITSLFCDLSTILEQSRVISVAKRTNGKWPTCPQDLMPFGPKNLVDSFIIWLRIIPDLIVVTVANQSIGFCGSLLIPSVITSDLTLHVIEAGRRLFDRTLETIRLRAESRRRATGEAFLDQIRPLMLYFAEFFGPLTILQQAAVIDNCELKAVQVFSLLSCAANDPRLCLELAKLHSANLEDRALMLYHSMKLRIRPLPPILLHPALCNRYRCEFPCERSVTVGVEDEGINRHDNGREGIHDSTGADEKTDGSVGQNQGSGELQKDLEATSENSEFDQEKSGADIEGQTDVDTQERMRHYTKVAMLVLPQIRKARSILNCSTQDCPNSIQSTGREFRRCTGCNVTLYCGEKCQSEAWNAELYPHKFICKVLHKVISVAGSDLIFYDLDSEYRGWDFFPRELLPCVMAKWWWNDAVSMKDLLQIQAWTSHKKLPSAEVCKTECLPGFDDYEATIRELCEFRDATVKAEYLIIDDPMSGTDADFEYLKKSFELISERAKSKAPVAPGYYF
ncbi:hypothetical protein BDN70DRAFT_877893 [Pholiota conissans]|uniref:MYND-type domain-containing protein n=1 Tax=Pholiota conissans TaxID=109636 RepID=A0A9P5Z673_9AGAR|nr:hypothetical protein BDN70DRAFT_877893 [Pholiota conissans]